MNNFFRWKVLCKMLSHIWIMYCEVYGCILNFLYLNNWQNKPTAIFAWKKKFVTSYKHSQPEPNPEILSIFTNWFINQHFNIIIPLAACFFYAIFTFNLMYLFSVVVRITLSVLCMVWITEFDLWKGSKFMPSPPRPDCCWDPTNRLSSGHRVKRPEYEDIRSPPGIFLPFCLLLSLPLHPFFSVVKGEKFGTRA